MIMTSKKSCSSDPSSRSPVPAIFVSAICNNYNEDHCFNHNANDDHCYDYNDNNDGNDFDQVQWFLLCGDNQLHWIAFPVTEKMILIISIITAIIVIIIIIIDDLLFTYFLSREAEYMQSQVVGQPLPKNFPNFFSL